jgi:hypothetical protein
MIPIALLSVLALLLIASFLWSTRNREWETQPEHLEERRPLDENERIRREQLVVRIFSREDRDFIWRTGSVRLQQLYRKERQRLALGWVHTTSRDIAKIMRVHRLRSRHSPNLDAGAEAKLMFEYLWLRLLCALLAQLIRALGPHALGDFAAYANGLYQGIGRAASVTPGAIPAETTTY